MTDLRQTWGDDTLKPRLLHRALCLNTVAARRTESSAWDFQPSISSTDLIHAGPG